MSRPRAGAWLMLALPWLAGAADVPERLVFGSFRSHDNAADWAAELGERFARPFVVERVHRDDGVWFRVRTQALAPAERVALEAAAAERDLAVWLIRGSYERPASLTSSSAAPAADTAAATGVGNATGPSGLTGSSRGARSRSSAGGEAASDATVYSDLDVAVQTRSYAEHGVFGQDRFQPSLSLRYEYHRSWDGDRSSFTFTPFLRLDGVDDERTHGDLRELFWSRIGDAWELHVGARQIFWGVTEFNHLVDIVNQTDLVENIDGEDKLGQPMVQLSLVRDWGIVDLFVMSAFRERTFPGEDGRLRLPLPVDTDDARYASGAGRGRIDGAVRWSHYLGPLSFGIHHFSGTGRDPMFAVERRGSELVLVPEYHVVDQTGLDAQAIFGDWAWKLETYTRSGHGERYFAYTAGFERTLVGVLGSRGDLGLVVEYMYDERDEQAFDTLFEHDLAVGARWRANDLADTTALAGLIRDVDTGEYLVTLEASRRLGASWLAVLEGRVFGGVASLRGDGGPSVLLDGRVKSRPFQDDDFLQLELTRFF